MLTARSLLDRCCPFYRCRLIVLCFPLMAVFALPGVFAAQAAEQPDETLQFRLGSGYLIVVQTKVNGAGPFDFLLDTGTTRTVIDPDLERQLQAPLIGEVSLTGLLHVRQDPMVQLQDVRLGEASLSGLGAVVDKLARQKMLAPGIRGVLGEDFLSKFDILIDYKRHSLRFGAAPPAGERCRFETTGQHHGLPTINRLLIAAEFMEVSRAKVQLQLDTGAKVPELFPVSRDSPSSQVWSGFIATSSGTNDITIHSNITIKIGTTMVPGQDVVQSRSAAAFDAAGLLPGAIFQRIYISHSGGFVVFNPAQ
jgi:Aspartyl protease